MLGDFLADPARASREYYGAAVAAPGSVRFAGRLEHDEVADVAPAADALVFPSTFPEAFGMVAAEAAAAGVLPVGAAHSGIAEVSRELAAALPDDAAPLVSFALGDGAVEAIAERLDRLVLAAGEAERARPRAALRRHGRPPVELGGRRRRRHRRLRGPPRRPPGTCPPTPRNRRHLRVAGGLRRRNIESPPVTRATYLKLVAAMVVLTVVSSVLMLIPDWNGLAGSEEAGPIDTLLDVMIVLSLLRLLHRHGDVRLRDLALSRQARRRVRRRADPRQHPPRDRLDGDPHDHRPVRRRLQLGDPRRHRGARARRRADGGERHGAAVRLDVRVSRGGGHVERASRPGRQAARPDASPRSTSCTRSGCRSGGSSGTWSRRGPEATRSTTRFRSRRTRRALTT